MNNFKLYEKTLIYTVLIFISILMVGPFIWQVFSAFKPQDEMFTTGFSIFAKNESTGKILMTLSNFNQVFDKLNFGVFFKNTLFVTTINICLNLFLNSMAGYAFSRIKFKGRDLIFKIMLTTLMIPGTVMLIPHVYIIKNLGLYDNLAALILPCMMSVYNVFMMRQFFSTIPASLEESARIDGASTFQIFYKIAVPLVKPALVTLAIMTFMWNYNNYLWPLVILNSAKNYTISLGLGSLVTQGSTKYHMMIAGSVIVSIPSITIFLIFQRHIVEGIMAGSVKG